jgi:hypothetical protein
MSFDSWHPAVMHKHTGEPTRESNQETLARVKKEMDQPRMAESTRGEDVNPPTQQELEKLPQSNVVRSARRSA